MHYIVFDLEFNQDIPSLQQSNEKTSHCPFEIIQIAAIKLDENSNTIGTFNRYVKPLIYSQINPFVTELTGITSEQLVVESPFPEIYKSFIEFIDKKDFVFCVWGMSDIKELFRNAAYHQLNEDFLSKKYLNLQPYVSIHLKLSSKKLLNLKHAVESLNIVQAYPFHDALYDAYYTAELFKKIYNPSMQPSLYDANHITLRTKQTKTVIDFDQLLLQFEKMYDRDITKEEQEMIQLAYKMGKTNQFLK